MTDAPSQTLTGWLPLAEDPANDPPDDLLLVMAQDAADQMAEEAGLTAGPVLIERLAGRYNDDGTYALGPDGQPLSPRGVLFRGGVR